MRMFLFTFLMTTASAFAAPPVVTVPKEVAGEVAAFVTVRAEVKEAKSVKFVPLDSGLSVFPSDLLTDKTVSVVVAQRAGRYRILVYAGNADGASDPVITTVVIGTPPEPMPPVPPTPDGKAPIPVDGFRVLMVYPAEGLTKLPASQIAIYQATTVRDYLNKKTVIGPDGRMKEWRVYRDGQDVSGDSNIWKDAMNLKRTSPAWIVISTGKTGYSGPLPLNTAETLSLLKKYGGE